MMNVFRLMCTLTFVVCCMGSQVTSYVMAAETYPTELRATCHGMSAFMGKTGALVATIVFQRKQVSEIFWICGGASVVGLMFTYIFSVDLTRVSLSEHDAQLELFLEGRPEQYKGKLNARVHLSNYEIWTGRHGQYDPMWAGKLVKEERSKLSSTVHINGRQPSLLTGIDESEKTE
jgi:hypothetical protein